MKKQQNMSQTKEQDKSLRDKTFIQQRVQNNGHKDVHGGQENNTETK